jgi:DNA-binding MarR family transcriptional regulator
MTPTKSQLIDQFAGYARAYQVAAEGLQDAAADSLGLNRTDQRCLDIVERRGPVSAGELAKAAGLSAKAITTAIDRLGRAGFAERTSDPHDRRHVLVAITEEGHRAAEEVYAPVVEASREMLERFTRDELEVLIDYLERSRELLGAQTARLQGGTFEAAGERERS